MAVTGPQKNQDDEWKELSEEIDKIFNEEIDKIFNQDEEWKELSKEIDKIFEGDKQFVQVGRLYIAQKNAKTPEEREALKRERQQLEAKISEEKEQEVKCRTTRMMP